MAKTSTKAKGAESQETQPRTTITGWEAEHSKKHTVSTFSWCADNHYVHESSSSATNTRKSKVTRKSRASSNCVQ